MPAMQAAKKSGGAYQLPALKIHQSVHVQTIFNPLNGNLLTKNLNQSLDRPIL